MGLGEIELAVAVLVEGLENLVALLRPLLFVRHLLHGHGRLDEIEIALAELFLHELRNLGHRAGRTNGLLFGFAFGGAAKATLARSGSRHRVVRRCRGEIMAVDRRCLVGK